MALSGAVLSPTGGVSGIPSSSVKKSGIKASIKSVVRRSIDVIKLRSGGGSVGGGGGGGSSSGGEGSGGDIRSGSQGGSYSGGGATTTQKEQDFGKNSSPQ